MNHLFKSLILSFVLAGLLGCDREKEAIPSYIHIKKFTFTTKSGQGLNTQDISDAKVFANGQEVGTFELPVTIPVIATGSVEITIIPNIKENGSSNYRKYYTPYISFIDTIDLEPIKIDTIQPTTTYRDLTTFSWIEDFDDQALRMVKYALNNTNDSIQIISTSTPGVDLPYSGSQYCGYIHIAKKDTFVDLEYSTLDWLSLPNLGRDVFVEMDFKSNVNMQVGVYIDNGTSLSRNEVLYTYPTDGKWKKIYINLKSEISDIAASSKVRVFFGIYKSQGDNETEPMVYLDNLKVVYVN
ncbi:MAG: hypothetical protein V4613_03685 [Bacteroidota bacterium]